MTTLGDLAGRAIEDSEQRADLYVENLLRNVVRSSPHLNDIEIEQELSRIKTECAKICLKNRYSENNDEVLKYLIDEHRKHFAAVQTLIAPKE